MPRPAKHALMVLASPELRAAKDKVKNLQANAVTQFKAVAAMESNTAKAAVLVGINLFRVKYSMPGEFREWVETMLPKGNIWTAATAVKNASYYMRLVLVFLEKTKLDKAALLAVGDHALLDLGDAAKAKKFVTALDRFVGEMSTNELLIKHNIKSVRKADLQTVNNGGEEEPDNDLTPAQRQRLQRENAYIEAWNATQVVRASLTEPAQMQLINEVKQVETIHAELVENTKLAAERLTALRAKK